MRMRKKKWAEGWMEEHSDYITNTPADYKGQWKKMLNKDILHVEIGMGKGDYLRQMSKMYPEAAWVGIERDPSAAAVAARKAVEENYDLSNNHMICGNAEFMLDWFEENEIDVIHLNFSDPWPKKHYHKRRLSSEKFLNIYKTLLNENGKILMKTDNKDLFDFSLEEMKNAEGWELTAFTYDLHHDVVLSEGNVMTEYEEKFSSIGNPICKMEARFL